MVLAFDLRKALCDFECPKFTHLASKEGSGY
jgi:hypothetical protein